MGSRSEAWPFMGREDWGTDETKLWLLRCGSPATLLIAGIFLLLDQVIKRRHWKSLPEPAPAAFSPSVAPNPVELLLPLGPLALRRPLCDSACYWAERREAGKWRALTCSLGSQCLETNGKQRQPQPAVLLLQERDLQAIDPVYGWEVFLSWRPRPVRRDIWMQPLTKDTGTAGHGSLFSCKSESGKAWICGRGDWEN